MSILELLHPEETEPVLRQHAKNAIKSLGYVAGQLQGALDQYDVDDPRFATAVTLIDTAWDLLDEAMNVVAGRDDWAWDPNEAALIRAVIAGLKGHDISACDLERAVDRLTED
jgi:hypothetical protein